MASAVTELKAHKGDRDREISNVEMSIEPTGGRRRGDLSRDPGRRERKVRAERRQSTFGRKRSLRYGGQLGGNLIEIPTIEKLIRQLLAPRSIASASLAGASRGFPRARRRFLAEVLFSRFLRFYFAIPFLRFVFSGISFSAMQNNRG